MNWETTDPDKCSHMPESGGGNLIVRELCPAVYRSPLSIHASLTLRIGIENRGQQRLTVEVRCEIARLPSRVGDRHDLGRRAPLLEAFVVEEEKCTVLAVVKLGDDDGAAESEAELVELERRPCSGEVGARIQLRAAEEFVQADVEIIRAGPDRDVDVGASGSTVPCRHVGLNLEFRNGVDRGSDGGRLEKGAIIVGAIERVVGVVASSARDRPCLPVERLAGAARSAGRAWGESDQV